MTHERNIEDYITYDSRENRYPRIINDFYRYYNDGDDLIGLDTLVRQASCGHKTADDFIREDGKRDMKALTLFSRNLMQLWNTDVSPESYMVKYDNFKDAVSAYADDVGIASAIDAHLSGVPIEDLLA